MGAGMTTDDYKPKHRSTFYFSTYSTLQQTPLPRLSPEKQKTHIVFSFKKTKAKKNPLPFLINVVPL